MIIQFLESFYGLLSLFIIGIVIVIFIGMIGVISENYHNSHVDKIKAENKLLRKFIDDLVVILSKK